MLSFDVNSRMLMKMGFRIRLMIRDLGHRPVQDVSQIHDPHVPDLEHRRRFLSRAELFLRHRRQSLHHLLPQRYIRYVTSNDRFKEGKETIDKRREKGEIDCRLSTGMPGTILGPNSHC